MFVGVELDEAVSEAGSIGGYFGGPRSGAAVGVAGDVKWLDRMLATTGTAHRSTAGPVKHGAMAWQIFAWAKATTSAA